MSRMPQAITQSTKKMLMELLCSRSTAPLSGKSALFSVLVFATTTAGTVVASVFVSLTGSSGGGGGDPSPLSGVLSFSSFNFKRLSVGFASMASISDAAAGMTPIVETRGAGVDASNASVSTADGKTRFNSGAETELELLLLLSKLLLTSVSDAIVGAFVGPLTLSSVANAAKLHVDTVNRRTIVEITNL